MFNWWRRWQQRNTLPSDGAQEVAGSRSEENSAENDSDTHRTLDERRHTTRDSYAEREQSHSIASISGAVSSEETTPKAKPTENLSRVTSSIPQFDLQDQSPASDVSASTHKQSVPQSEKTLEIAPSRPDGDLQPPTQNRPCQSAQDETSLAPPRSAVKLDMAPPPRLSGGTTLQSPPSAASSLRVPMNRSLAVEARSSIAGGSRISRTVPLKPGHSPLDWAALTSNPANSQLLRGDDVPVNKFIRVKPAMLKAHDGRKGMNAWTSYKGKVYNITPYIPFHPGGKGELLRCAGKDAGKLFNEIHPWVNWDGMLGECLIGILVSDNDALMTLSPLEEMD
ncbi:hypothetical protein KEM54_005210 [Ascosphaera aggregata]|nr:hypothetical protein KEM54_005210 [Ascosphaera aggregata]